MTQLLKLISVTVLSIFVLAGCVAPRGNSPEEKRAAIQGMKAETLNALYKEKPSAKEVVDKSVGYAVFSNVGAIVILGGGGAGYGVAIDQRSGHETYMQMAQVGVGVGLGVQDIRIVMVFHSQRAFDHFITSGWEFGAQADAAATARDKGVEMSHELSINNETTTYALTEAGLMAKVNLVGTKYWLDNSLN